MTEPGPAPPPPPAEGPPSAGYTPPQGASGPRASFGRRLVAFLVDAIILSVVYWVAVFVLDLDGGGGGPAFLNLIVGIAYYTGFEGSARGQTPGKMALGIRVVDFNTGTSIGYGRAFLRYIGRILSTIPCLLGYFWMLWDREKQTWHDKIATDVVVPVAAYPVS